MPQFKHGTRIDSKNYLEICAGPLRGKRVHILVAEAMLGRALTADETCHHVNLDKLDCSPSNLRVKGRADHGFISNRQKWFLENRNRKELAAYQEWISEGGVRPDEDPTTPYYTGLQFEHAAAPDVAAAATAVAPDTTFNPEEMQ